MRLIACALALLAACSSSPTTPSRPPPTPAAGSAAAVESHRPADTGAVDEATFKAMHAAVPADAGKQPRLGHDIELAGTKAYLAKPAGAGPFPAIVVIHEWWGLNDNIRNWADRLARAGWAALAVDFYGGVVATDRDSAMAAMKAASDAEAERTVAAAFDYLARDPGIRATRRAVIGWCFGGGWSLQTALTHPELDGAIIYYGQLETDPRKLANIHARVLGIFGTQDKGIPVASVKQFEAALQQAGVDAEIHLYDADHAFANPSNPVYDQEDAAAAWREVQAFLDLLRSAR